MLDPNALSGDGTVALMGAEVSDDGKTLAYATQSGGSDWLTWQVRDVASGQDVGGPLRWSKFSGAAWLPDGSGFFYSAYDAPQAGEGSGEALTSANRNQRLMFHRLGQAQEHDELVLSRPDQPDWGFSGRVSEDGRWLLVSVWLGTSPKNQLWVRRLTGADPSSVGDATEQHASDEVAGPLQDCRVPQRLATHPSRRRLRHQALAGQQRRGGR